MREIKILVLTHPEAPKFRLPEILPAAARFVVGDSPKDFEGAGSEAEVFLSWFGQRDQAEAVWNMSPNLRWVHSLIAGLEGFLFPALVASPVPLTNGRGVFSESLAEFAMAGALHFAKDLRRMVREQEAGRWTPFDIEDLSGHTMGIVGYGDIGRAVAQKAKAFNMKILALRKRPELSRDDPLVDEVFPVEKRIELLQRSDYVVAATPLTSETRLLIGETEIAALKPTAVFINVGRGAVVDEQALIRALQARRIRGAVLDVYEREPLLPNHPLYSLENVLLSAHCADHSPGWLDRAVNLFWENLERYREGRPLIAVVEKHIGY